MSKYKCPKTGNFITQALFFELKHDHERALYTLKEEDHTLPDGRVLPSLKRLYLECLDPTEYEFATTYFYSWKHWKRCLGNKLVLKEVEEWREELEIKIRSEGLRGAINNAMDGNYQANKWLVDKGWVEKIPGRPTNERVEGELKQAARMKEAHQSDLDRISEYLN